MRAALVIAARILRQGLRDRSAIIFSVVAPLGLATAFSLLIPSGSASFRTTFAVHDADRGALSTVLVDQVLGRLVSEGIADVTHPGTEAAALADVDAGRARVAILVPAGFSAAIQSNRPTSVRIVAGPDAEMSALVARSVVGSFAMQVGAVQLAEATTVATGAPGTALDPALLARIQAAVTGPSPIATGATSADRRQAGSSTFYAASMAIMFLFFGTQYGILALLGERRRGTLTRLLAAPIRPASIILGATLAGFAMGILSVTIIAVATTLMLGAHWGSPPLVAALLVAAVAAACGISTLLASLARTEDQAGNWNAIVAMTLAILGGTFIPISQAPEILSRLSLITPHAWFLRAIDELSSASATLADIAPSLAVLLAIGGITGAIGLFRARGALVAR